MHPFLHHPSKNGIKWHVLSFEPKVKKKAQKKPFTKE